MYPSYGPHTNTETETGRGEAAASRHLATMAAPHPALAALILGLATSGVQAIGADILTELISFPLRSNPFFAKVAKKNIKYLIISNN